MSRPALISSCALAPLRPGPYCRPAPLPSRPLFTPQRAPSPRRSTENYEKAAQAVKEALERKFGPTWNVCVGEGFGYDVTYNAKHCLLVYYGEKLGVLLFKC